ncbi:transcription termination factor MTEF18, mitochondrial-like [Andrographis paniculata]|uniref:transcription termination factor MTEF18, mitochondrial-like n=1 Tax=Andrographis paniculata TaxID=175694 RepID=UPI0021E8D513|nr:transcription termination factor MTEF18, mitochondrial-like [Andrographis paniculata]XP_051138638.1 transcription termination factor MTEF18, mitochondrial-like [Andrographis paniculata]
MATKSLGKLKISQFLKPVSLSNPNFQFNGPYNLLHHRLCRTASTVDFNKIANLGDLAKKSRLVRSEAQAALFDYFHTARGLQIMDAENMSKNTPAFFDNLAQRVDVYNDDACRSVARFLRYNPVNEFEPFFESIGLKPFEYVSFLPKDTIYLNDDELLLENYSVLCDFGIARNWIGRIYKDAREVFKYESGILRLKLQSMENLGLKHSVLAKVVASAPRILTSGVGYPSFVETLSELKKVGIEQDWLEEHLSLEDSYDWECMLELISSLSRLGLSEDRIGELLTRHPHLLLEHSGRITFALIGFLLKFGSTSSDVQNVLLKFSQIPVVKFGKNLQNSYRFLTEIDMAVKDVGWVVRSHATLLGCHELKKANSLLALLNSGKNTLCQMIKNDPRVLQKWIYGVRVEPLHKEKRVSRVRMIKTKFLLSIGFVENSEEMEKAFRGVRGKVEELQERFDYLVNLGISHEEVVKMVKVAPQILNQSKDVVETKIGFFFKDLGLQVSDLVGHPKLVSYTIERVKLRLAMYDWLRKEEVRHTNLSLCSLLTLSDKEFVKLYVKCHPKGVEHWENLQKEIYSDRHK